jgi:hypothetical protein
MTIQVKVLYSFHDRDTTHHRTYYLLENVKLIEFLQLIDEDKKILMAHKVDITNLGALLKKVREEF